MCIYEIAELAHVVNDMGMSGDQKRDEKRKSRSKSKSLSLQCQHLIIALNSWPARAYYTTKRPTAILFTGHRCMDDLTTERSFDSQATWVIDVLGLLFDMLYMGECITRQWQVHWCRN